MEFDENKKLDVEISQNDFVENRISKKRKKERINLEFHKDKPLFVSNQRYYV